MKNIWKHQKPCVYLVGTGLIVIGFQLFGLILQYKSPHIPNEKIWLLAFIIVICLFLFNIISLTSAIRRIMRLERKRKLDEVEKALDGVTYASSTIPGRFITKI